MKLFDETILNDVFDSVATDISVNGSPVKGVITTPTLNKLDDQELRHLHTMERVTQGDIVDYSGVQYLVTSESMSKRGGKYKNVLDHCNVMLKVVGATTKVEVGRDDFNRPIYDYIEEVYDVPAVANFNRVGAPSEVAALTILRNSLTVKLRKSDENLLYVTVNKEYTINEKLFKVSHIDKLQSGILIIQLDGIT